jgi:hypothetical protein
MSDSVGDVRQCFPRLASYIGDYPEQQLINVAAHNYSPVTIAGLEDLGSAKILPFRTRHWILSRIRRLCAKVDPSDIMAYEQAAKEQGLSAVHEPFWEHLPGYQPELCVGPDILHGLLKLWRDHVLKWAKKLVGSEELDRRLRVLQPIVGVRHFSKGLRNLSQWTGREDRELQRFLVAVIAGAPKVDSKSMRCFRAFHDFLYLAQYRSHSADTVRYLGRALSEFHVHKNIFLQNRARYSKKSNLNHFRIPKIAAMHAYVYHIPQMGSSPQFSTEISETLHQTMAKKAYRLSNRRAFEVQMCRYLDRADKIVQMNNFLDWATPKLRERRIAAELEQYPEAYRERALEEIRATLDSQLEVPLAHKKQGQPSRIWHTLTPHARKMPLGRVCNQYNIPQIYLSSKVQQFLQEEDTPAVNCGTIHLDVWYRFRIQLPTVQELDQSAQSRTVQALPPTNALPYGRGDCVLVHDTEAAGPTGIQGKSINCPLSTTNQYSRLSSCTG